MLAAALRAGAFVFAAYATGRVLSRRARAGDERRIEQLRRECGTDMLTGLLNRRGGQEKAETMLAMCRRCEKPMAVLMADIDHFKEYNDAHGHLAGDGALCRVGGALQSVLCLLYTSRQTADAARIVQDAGYERQVWAGFSAGCDMLLRTLLYTCLLYTSRCV